MHLLGPTNKDVIELQMSRVDANYFKRKGGHRVLKTLKQLFNQNLFFFGEYYEHPLPP